MIEDRNIPLERGRKVFVKRLVRVVEPVAGQVQGDGIVAAHDPGEPLRALARARAHVRTEGKCATALFASLTFSRSFWVRNRLTEAMTRSPARRLRT
jgi:hypothetical protein